MPFGPIVEHQTKAFETSVSSFVLFACVVVSQNTGNCLDDIVAAAGSKCDSFHSTQYRSKPSHSEGNPEKMDPRVILESFEMVSFFLLFFLAKHFLCQNKIRLYNALEIISRPCLNFADTTICWDKFCTLHSYHVWLRHGILEPEPLKDNIHILAEYTATDGCLLCSKVDLMEEDRSRQVLEPTQNPAMEAVFQ